MYSSKPLLFLIIISGFIFSCNTQSTPKKIGEISKEDNADTISEIFDSNTDFLKIAADFAEEYNPASTKEYVVQQLINTPDSIIKAFKYLRKTSNPKLEIYLTLIFLKLYKSHIECCHQSYELRTKIPLKGNIDSIADPLLYEFILLTNYFNNNNRIEFISSGIAHSWVETNKHLLENCKIKKEFEKIEQISKKIEKGVY